MSVKVHQCNVAFRPEVWEAMQRLLGRWRDETGVALGVPDLVRAAVTKYLADQNNEKEE